MLDGLAPVMAGNAADAGNTRPGGRDVSAVCRRPGHARLGVQVDRGAVSFLILNSEA